MNKPLITVIMPAYNSENFIAESIESVLAQDFDNIELLVIDDGSTDRTAEIARSYAPAVTLLESDNGGAAAARNQGMAIARGKYISFLDSDDIWHPQKLSTQCKYLEKHPNVGVVYCAWEEWNLDDDRNWIIPEYFRQPIKAPNVDPHFCGWLYAKLLMDCVVHTITVLIRRSVIDVVGMMNTNLVCGEDYDYWLRVSRHFQIHKMRNLMALYRIRPGSLARTVHERNFEFEVLDNALRTWGPISPDGVHVSNSLLRRRKAQLWIGFAYAHLNGGNCTLAADAAKRAILERPFWYQGWKFFILSMLTLHFGRSAPT